MCALTCYIWKTVFPMTISRQVLRFQKMRKMLREELSQTEVVWNQRVIPREWSSLYFKMKSHFVLRMKNWTNSWRDYGKPILKIPKLRPEFLHHSVEDKRALEVMERTLKMVDGHYQVALHWRYDPPYLPNNRVIAEACFWRNDFWEMRPCVRNIRRQWLITSKRVMLKGSRRRN